MQWFGSPGGAPYEADCQHVATPVGATCAWCDEPFVEGDDGVVLPVYGGESAAFHYECHLRQVIGGLNHLRGNCTCCGGSEPPDPPWLSRRQAALQAVHVWQQEAMRRSLR
jgi:hypothetical protein